jgi:hypothetical protein
VPRASAHVSAPSNGGTFPRHLVSRRVNAGTRSQSRNTVIMAAAIQKRSSFSICLASRVARATSDGDPVGGEVACCVARRALAS